MQPWPSLLRSRYPLSPHLCPERPWWPPAVVILLQVERLLSAALRGSVHEVANVLEINYRTLHEVRRGKRRVSLERVERALAAYHQKRPNLQLGIIGYLPELEIRQCEGGGPALFLQVEP